MRVVIPSENTTAWCRTRCWYEDSGCFQDWAGYCGGDKEINQKQVEGPKLLSGSAGKQRKQCQEELLGDCVVPAISMMSRSTIANVSVGPVGGGICGSWATNAN